MSSLAEAVEKSVAKTKAKANKEIRDAVIFIGFMITLFLSGTVAGAIPTFIYARA